MNIHPKVALAGVGSSLAVILIYCLSHYAHQNFPAEVGAAITAVVAAVCGWLTPSPPPEAVEPLSSRLDKLEAVVFPKQAV